MTIIIKIHLIQDHAWRNWWYCCCKWTCNLLETFIELLYIIPSLKSIRHAWIRALCISWGMDQPTLSFFLSKYFNWYKVKVFLDYHELGCLELEIADQTIILYSSNIMPVSKTAFNCIFSKNFSCLDIDQIFSISPTNLNITGLSYTLLAPSKTTWLKIRRKKC